MKFEELKVGNIIKNRLKVKLLKLLFEITQHPMHHQLYFVTCYDLRSQKFDVGYFADWELVADVL